MRRKRKTKAQLLAEKLCRRMDMSRWKLEELQREMQAADGKGSALRPLHIMQQITETIADLKVQS